MVLSCCSYHVLTALFWLPCPEFNMPKFHTVLLDETLITKTLCLPRKDKNISLGHHALEVVRLAVWEFLKFYYQIKNCSYCMISSSKSNRFHISTLYLSSLNKQDERNCLELFISNFFALFLTSLRSSLQKRQKGMN
jgi:hypothetical protein